MKQTKKGFTLIEVLTVIALIGIMTAVMFVTLSQGRIDKQLENASRQIASDIRGLQRSVLSGATPGSNPICGLGLNTTAGSASYQFFAVYKTGSDACVSSPTTMGTLGGYQNKTLEGGVTMTTFPQRDLYFMVPHGKVYVGGSGDTSIKITLSKGTSNNYVCVSSSGEVKENGSSSSCP